MIKTIVAIAIMFTGCQQTTTRVDVTHCTLQPEVCPVHCDKYWNSDGNGDLAVVESRCHNDQCLCAFTTETACFTRLITSPGTGLEQFPCPTDMDAYAAENDAGFREGAVDGQ
jgi:hypothetical protein